MVGKPGLFVLVCAMTVPLTAQLNIEVPGTVNPGPKDIRVDGNSGVKSVTCASNALFVRGNNNRVQVGGTCTAVYVMGNGNTLTVQHATKLNTMGNRNMVNYLDPQTQVNTLGNGNTVVLSK